ncbi:MAG: pyridoxal-phosphate dependent enzyme, partial [Gammaproteobacteria bacterium]
LTTETGAGQWGCSLSLAGQIFGLDVRVYMVKISYEQNPYRRTLMRTWGAEVFPSPTDMTESGRHILAQHPDSDGSLGIAISEAVEEAASRDDTNYALGSVLNHVLLHQTIIGQEAKKQLEMAGDYPDMIFSPCGGGSCFGGIAFPFFADKAAGKDIRLVAVEPSSCPSLTKGVYAYDFGDTEGLTPLMKMYTLGHDFMPPGIHAVPAPESCHAVAGALREAKRCKETGEPKTLLFNLSGHGHFDMSAYERFLDGELTDYDYPAEAIAESLQHLPKVG